MYCIQVYNWYMVSSMTYHTRCWCTLHLMSTGQLFIHSCIPGAMDKDYNPNQKPVSLCEGCAAGGFRKCQRTSEDQYYSASGAFRCLVESEPTSMNLRILLLFTFLIIWAVFYYLIQIYTTCALQFTLSTSGKENYKYLLNNGFKEPNWFNCVFFYNY